MAARRRRRGGRGAGGASGSSRVTRSCACVLMVSVRPEAMRRGALGRVLEGYVVAGGVPGCPQFVEVGIRRRHLRPGEPAVEDGEVDQAAEDPALLERKARAVPRDVAVERQLGQVILFDRLDALD